MLVVPLEEETFAAINLKPYQGLKHTHVEFFRIIGRQAAINLKPYQGLKLIDGCWVIADEVAAINLKPYQGLKQEVKWLKDVTTLSAPQLT